MDYKSYHKEVISMQHRINDTLDDRGHSEAKQLVQLFQKLEDDVQVQKNVHSIRDQLKRIESHLRSLDDKVMSHNDVDHFLDWVVDSLRQIR